ncbi:MAG: hypothetical protein HY279_04830 [Nitrospinae bacterium]|nr:hypothetical protein [Nitrospinota bacterium]
MNNHNVDEFLSSLKTFLKNHFAQYKIEFLIRTPKSLKANIHLDEKFFIAARYNARNGRMDFALIQDDKRIFGYDNLKEWHYHPYKNPSVHIPCDKPSTDKILFEIKKIYETTK